MSLLVKQPIHWVDNQAALDRWCEGWRQHSLLAVDTEFMRSQTFYPKAALIQVNDGVDNVLLDPTQPLDYSAFAALLLDPNITKALHACSEDLEVFHRLFRALPNNIFDTQIAAAALGFGYSIGYGSLVKQTLKIDLPKGETRSDWLQRPLSQAQIHYAAIDVEYLFPIARAFMAALNDKQRQHWVQEEYTAVQENFYSAQDPQQAFSRIKGAWKLDSQQLACLMALCEWREKTAQRRDVPRNRVVKELSLFKLAQCQPSQVAQLRTVEGLNDRMIRADGEGIIAAISGARDLPAGQQPARLAHPLGGADNRIVKALRDKVSQLAENLGVAPELLVKKRDYESLLRNPHALPKSLGGWRKPVVGENLLAWLDELNTNSDNSGGGKQ